jgi:hypothetical protein
VAVGSIRLDAFPDGGISRVRALGSIELAARRRAGYRWFNALPSTQAAACLVAASLSADAAAQLVGLRPMPGTWVDDQRGGANSQLVQGLTQAQLPQLAALLEGAS